MFPYVYERHYFKNLTSIYATQLLNHFVSNVVVTDEFVKKPIYGLVLLSQAINFIILLRVLRQYFLFNLNFLIASKMLSHFGFTSTPAVVFMFL